MIIEPLSLTVLELCGGYADHAEDGVVAFGKFMRLYDRIMIRRRK